MSLPNVSDLAEEEEDDAVRDARHRLDGVLDGVVGRSAGVREGVTLLGSDLRNMEDDACYAYLTVYMLVLSTSIFGYIYYKKI